MATVTEIWGTIHEWMEANAPQVLTSLKPGVSEEQLKNLEEKLELNDLPEDFKDCYRIHDGSTAGGLFVKPFNSNTFLSVEDIVQDWLVNKKIFDEENFGPHERQAEEPLEIQSTWWLPRWIPFGNNGCGDLLSIDLDPTEAGTFGQVIQWYNNGGYYELLAPSMTEFLRKFAEDLEDGKFVEPDHGGNYLLRKENCDNSHCECNICKQVKLKHA